MHHIHVSYILFDIVLQCPAKQINVYVMNVLSRHLFLLKTAVRLKKGDDKSTIGGTLVNDAPGGTLA